MWESVGSVLSANAQIQQINVAGVYDMLFHAIEVFVYFSAAGIAAALHALHRLCRGTTHVLHLRMLCRPVQSHVLAAQKGLYVHHCLLLLLSSHWSKCGGCVMTGGVANVLPCYLRAYVVCWWG